MDTYKVAVVHLLPAPYRLPLFERLLKDEALDVRLFFTDQQAPNRPTWTVENLPSDPRVVRLPEIAVPILKKRGDVFRVNVGLSRIFKWRPDLVLVYGHNELTSIIVALMCIVKGIPYAFFAEVSNNREWSVLRRITIVTMALLIRKAAVLVPASESCQSFYSQLGGRIDQMILIPCVPDIEKLRSRSEELASRREGLRRDAGLSNRLVVLFVGRMVEHKGVKDLLDAVTKIRVKDPNIVVLLAGYGPLEEYVKTECSKMPEHAKYIGFVDDRRLAELYSIADLHVMPSWDEPYGVVCAEALAFGVPSIITETAGCVDLIRNGLNGFIIRPRSPQAIADGVLAVSANPVLLASLKANARATLSGLDMDHIYEKLTDVIAKAHRRNR